MSEGPLRGRFEILRRKITEYSVQINIASNYAIHKWLQDFAYRTEIIWWFFAFAGAAAIAIALATISMQTVKAALANPVKSLRTE